MSRPAFCLPKTPIDLNSKLSNRQGSLGHRLTHAQAIAAVNAAPDMSDATRHLSAAAGVPVTPADARRIVSILVSLGLIAAFAIAKPTTVRATKIATDAEAQAARRKITEVRAGRLVEKLYVAVSKRKGGVLAFVDNAIEGARLAALVGERFPRSNGLARIRAWQRGVELRPETDVAPCGAIFRPTVLNCSSVNDSADFAIDRMRLHGIDAPGAILLIERRHKPAVIAALQAARPTP